jgi:hypothetical protein
MMHSSDAGTLTDFLRQPKKALKRLEKEDVVLARRGKGSIRISLETRTRAAVDRNELAATLLADTVAAAPEIRAPLVGVLEKRYPWVRFLSPNERELFARELVDTIQAGVSVGRLARIEELFAAWKATAEIHAEPELAKKLKGPFEETTTPVRRP